MKNNKGFTLLELILVLGLVGLVLSLIFSPMILSYNSFNAQNEKTNIISDTRATMDYLTREIRKSDKIEVIHNRIILDNVVYKLKDKDLLKDDKVVSRGIDRLNITKTDKRLEIEITITDNSDKEHTLSSIIYIR